MYEPTRYRPTQYMTNASKDKRKKENETKKNQNFFMNGGFVTSEVQEERNVYCAQMKK